ncbi:MAG: 16S rRNA (cytosine(1402)-N(4))-methyltransferase RsmH [Coriobacteriia bacterium]|jgi:16S rRNA (cytosine1402-N4)-methyltransferase|nr:16S rRNA (cytosine(1402)-N(4))-methyltransferase RsmH [Coriobacteriia bacterium]
MEYRHTPVLPAEVTQHLSLHPGSIIVDCTLGGAGHAKRIADSIAPTGTLVGIDQDDAALNAAADALRLGRQITLMKGNFADIDRLLVEAGIAYVDGFLFDLGVSSPQLDVTERGFSYHDEAPLDMRMDPSADTLTAAEIVNTYEETVLAQVIRDYGEERWASRIAAFIVAARARRSIETTADLVSVIKAAVPASARRGGPHPARRTFQALRIEVNHELERLESGLRAAVRWLVPGGRIVVISYHSLEDRLVKQVFQELASGCECPPQLPVCVCGKVPVVRIVTKRPIVPGRDEITSNPRARSAKMRVAEKI